MGYLGKSDAIVGIAAALLVLYIYNDAKNVVTAIPRAVAQSVSPESLGRQTVAAPSFLLRFGMGGARTLARSLL